MQKSFTKQKAFTLIELLVVIAIIAILAAILFPVFAAAREKARTTTCLNNMKQIGMALIQYTQDYDEAEPYSYYCIQSGVQAGWYQYLWSDALYPYVKAAAVFNCPDDQFVVGTGGHHQEYLEPTGSGPTFNSEYATGSYLPNSSYRQNSQSNPRTGGDYGPIVSSENGAQPVSASQITCPATTAAILEGAQYNSTSPTWTYDANYAFDPYNKSQMAYYASAGPQGYAIVEGCNPCYATPSSGGSVIVARHNGLINIAWCDGHVKAMTIPALLQNTNSGGYYTDLIIGQ